MPKNKQSDRARIDFNLGDPNVQAQMQARDTFVAPGQVTYGRPQGIGDNLIALGKSLGVGLQKYQAFDNQRTERMIKEQTLKAQKDFQINRKSFKDAVKSGLIPEGANPHYIRSYQQSELGNLADTFASDLEVSMMNDKLWENANGNDISDQFTDYKNQKLNQFMKDNNIQGRFGDLDIAQIFAPAIQKAEANLLKKSTDQQVIFNEKEGVRIASEKMRSVADRLIVGDLSDLELEWKGGEEPSEGEVITATIKYYENMLNNTETGLIANGMSGSTANETLARTILSVARDTLDDSWLSVLNGIKGNAGAYISKTVKISELISQTRSYITQKEQTNIKFNDWLSKKPMADKMFKMKFEHMKKNAIFDRNRLFFDKKKRKQLTESEWIDTLTGSWQIAILNDPDALTRKGEGSWNDPWLVEEMNKLDPNMRKKIVNSVITIRKEMNEFESFKYYHPTHKQHDNYLKLYGEIINPDGGNNFVAIDEALRQGEIKEGHWEKLRQAELNKNTLKHQIYSSPMWDNILNMIGGMFKGKDENAEYVIPGLGVVSMESLKLKAHLTAYEFLRARAKGLDGGVEAVPGVEVIKDVQLWLQGYMLPENQLPGQNVGLGKTDPYDTKKGQTEEQVQAAMTGTKIPEPNQLINKVNPGLAPEDMENLEKTKKVIKDNLEVLRTVDNPEMFADLFQKGTKMVKDFTPVPGDPRATSKKLDKLYDDINNLAVEAKERRIAKNEVATEVNKFMGDPIMKEWVKPFITAMKQPNTDWITLAKKAKRLQLKKDQILKRKKDKEEEAKKVAQMKKEDDEKKAKAETKRLKKLQEIERETKTNKSLKWLEDWSKKKK